MNNSPWKFSELKFPKPNLRAFQDMNEDAIRRIEEARDGDDVLEVVFEHNELLRRVDDLIEVTHIRHSLDTTNDEYEEDRLWVNENEPLFEKASVEFHEAINRSPFRDYIEEKIGSMYFTKIDTGKNAFCEENIPLMQRESELTDEYQKVIAQCYVEIDGKKRGFLELQRLWSHENREVRKAAAKALSSFLLDNEQRLEEVWDELIKVRTQMGKNLGYDNYLPVAYLKRGRIDFGPEEVANLRQQVVDEIVPLCVDLYEAQRKRLGLDELMAYDEPVVYPDGNGKPEGDHKYMLQQIVNMMRDLSPETHEFIDFIIGHELADTDSRPGKAAREYSTIITSKKAPFVFTFFDGTAKSVKTLVGGLGHAFSAYRSMRKQPIKEYYYSSADIMEIHVMTMTLFSIKYAQQLFGDDAKKYEYYNLHDLMTFIPFGMAIDEFQHICYEKPELTPKERNAEWIKLEKKYMPWRKYEADDEFMAGGGFWYQKHHVFLYPLYYIEYSLATLNAMEMYKKFVEHPGIAWEDYLALADIGGSKGYLDTLKTANLTPAFEDGAVSKMISYAKDVLLSEIETN